MMGKVTGVVVNVLGSHAGNPCSNPSPNYSGGFVTLLENSVLKIFFAFFPYINGSKPCTLLVNIGSLKPIYI